MDLNQALHLAYSLMSEHNLFAQGWKFKFDGGKRRFGVCKYSQKVIGLSRHLTVLNSDEQVRDTILHEIAHALCGRIEDDGRVHHGPKWKAIAQSIGCTGERCFDMTQTVMPTYSYLLTCPNCGKQAKRYRMKRKPIACGKCCNAHNNGRFDERFIFIITKI